MSRLVRFMGLESPTPQAVKLAGVFATIVTAFSASFQISTTFYTIFIAEALGGGDFIVGMGMVGLLVALQLGVQTILDYPTGAIGDWIGQRYVIASALVCYSVVFGLTSTLTPSSPFYVFLLIYIIQGLGNSQESGAWGAWFDSNYRVAMPHDTGRKQYGVFMGKLNMIGQIVPTLILVPGSWLALVYGRAWVFEVQAIICIVLALLVLRTVKDLPGVRQENAERPKLNEYGTLLKDGMKFLGSSRFVIFLTLGEVIMYSTSPVWGNLILWPFYFSYLFTDVAVSAFRTTLFAPMAVGFERSGVWAKKFDPAKWIPRLKFVSFGGTVFFAGLAAITFFFPPLPEPGTMISVFVPFTDLALFEIPQATVIPIVLEFFLIIVTSTLGSIAGILSQRVWLDVIPNKIRNSMYSLRTTLIILASLPLLPFFGWVIPVLGFPVTFVLCTAIVTAGNVFVWKSFKEPIPKVADLEKATIEVAVAESEKALG
jgi:MFS family permease